MNIKTHKKYEKSADNAVIVNQVMNLEDLIDAAFKYCEKEILKNFLLLSKFYNDEYLHQLRISLRKFKSILSLFKNEIAKKEWSKANKIYKALINPTSFARDVDVVKTDYINPAFEKNKTDIEFHNLNHFIEDKQISLHSNIEKILSSEYYKNLLNDLQNWSENKIWLKDFVKHNDLKDAQLKKFINKKVKSRHKEITQAKTHITSYTHKDLHRLRIKIKELRYIHDILDPYLKYSKHEIKYLKNLQNVLGKFNDTYLAEKVMLKTYTNGDSTQSRSYIEQQAHHRRHKYLAQLEKIN